jgi:hypothetical protein
MSSPNLIFQDSTINSGHVLFTHFHALESHTEQTNPSTLMFALCQDINSTKDEHLNIRFNQGIIGEWQSTLTRTFFNASKNRDGLHLGQIVASFKSPLNNTQAL